MSKEEVDGYVPENNIELSMAYTNSMWGDDQEINQAFRDKLTKKTEYIDKDTGILVKKVEEKLWEQLQFFTRDLRLGNLTSTEIVFCTHYLDLAADFLKEGYIDAFTVALCRVARTTELSQSRGGFLRKRLNTFTRENKDSFDSPKKSGVFHQANANKY